MNRKKVTFFLLFSFLSLKMLTAQETKDNEKEQKLIRHNYSDTIRPEYILNIKLKRKPNSRKVEIVSMRYEKRQSRIFKMLLAQKERIKKLEAKNQTNKK